MAADSADDTEACWQLRSSKGRRAHEVPAVQVRLLVRYFVALMFSAIFAARAFRIRPFVAESEIYDFTESDGTSKPMQPLIRLDGKIDCSVGQLFCRWPAESY